MYLMIARHLHFKLRKSHDEQLARGFNMHAEPNAVDCAAEEENKIGGMRDANTRIHVHGLFYAR